MKDMLNYFVSFAPQNKDVLKICTFLDEIKRSIEKKDYSVHYETKELFRSILEFAKDINDEDLANAQYVFSQYYCFFTSLSLYFQLLEDKAYRDSWNTLQDCLDIAKFIGRFVDLTDRLDLPKINELLVQYEKLYPFTVFASAEYVISQSHCSICGKSMLGFECPHRVGQLYWGELAKEVFDERVELQAIAIVSNPEDKRCIFELKEEKNNNNLYEKLEEFKNLNLEPLRSFTINSKIETRIKENAKVVGRNDLCPCGSGKKYKKCCGADIFYKYERNIVEQGELISLYYFNIHSL